MYSHMCQLSVLYITRFIYGLWCMRGNLILSCFLLNVVFVCFFLNNASNTHNPKEAKGYGYRHPFLLVKPGKTLTKSIDTRKSSL